MPADSNLVWVGDTPLYHSIHCSFRARDQLLNKRVVRLDPFALAYHGAGKLFEHHPTPHQPRQRA